MNAHIFNIQRYCLHDGPGVRTTVFFKGCPLHCIWCHNPESQASVYQVMYYTSKCTGCGRCLSLCDARTLDPSVGRIAVDRSKCTSCQRCIDACLNHANELCGREESVEEIFATVLRDRVFYGTDGGMTLSGGEPALQKDASLALLRMAREDGLSSVIETSGFGAADFFREAAELGAQFYYDLKNLDSERHRLLTGVPNDRILENLRMLMEMRAKIVLRLPLIPGCNDSDSELALLGRFLAEHEDAFDHAEIMRYHILGKSKADALGQDYDAPPENASTSDAERWMRCLKDAGARKILFSQ